MRSEAGASRPGSGTTDVTDTNPGGTGGTTQVPEPATLGLLGAGLAFLGIMRRRRQTA